MGTVPVTMPAPEAPASIGPFGRIVGMFFSPKATFEDIVRKPTWLIPVVVLTLLSIVVCISINQRVDWREFIAHQMEQSPSTAQLSSEQKQQRIEVGAKYAPIATYLFGVPAAFVIILLVGLVMMGAYNLIGGAGASYKTSLAITAHAFCVSILSSLLFVLILFLKAFGTVDLDNPVAANVGAFLPDGIPKWELVLGKSLDIFSIWILVLLAIGFGAANPRKLKGGKPFTIAFSVWAVYVVLHVGWTFIFS